MADDPGLVRAGRVTSSHGLDGSIKIADPVPALLAKGMELLVDGNQRTIERRSGTDAKPIIRLSGCTTREDANALRGSILSVPRDSVPALGEDEWWTSELVGCSVVDADLKVGVVTAVIGLPSCEALEVERSAGEPLLVPMIGDAVRSVDSDGRIIDIDLAFLGEA